ncbi:MAG: hypothetical protein K8R89_02170 [Anaerolineae bacterium]|nr:hypothetical protein [Anaerolineae bacterium]
MSKATLFAKSIQAAHTPAGKLRAVLEQLESQLGRATSVNEQTALYVLQLFDEAATLLSALQATGGDWRSEETRLETTHAKFRRRGRSFLKSLGGAEKFAALHSTNAPAQPGWWWQLDKLLATERRVRLHRGGKWALGILALLLVLGGLYRQFLAPPPELVASVQHQYAAEELLDAGDYAAALCEIELGLQAMPDKPDMLILKGVLHELLAEPAEAAPAYARAEQLLASRAFLLEERAHVYLSVQLLVQSQADAQELLKLEPRSAIAQLYLGMIAEAQGELQTAREHYETASAWASKSEEAEIYVMARVQLANLMRTIPEPTAVEGTAP